MFVGVANPEILHPTFFGHLQLKVMSVIASCCAYASVSRGCVFVDPTRRSYRGYRCDRGV